MNTNAYNPEKQVYPFTDYSEFIKTVQKICPEYIEKQPTELCTNFYMSDNVTLIGQWYYWTNNSGKIIF